MMDLGFFFTAKTQVFYRKEYAKGGGCFFKHIVHIAILDGDLHVVHIVFYVPIVVFPMCSMWLKNTFKHIGHIDFACVHSSHRAHSIYVPMWYFLCVLCG